MADIVRSNRTIERIYKALVSGSRKTLPTTPADLKFAKLRRFFAPLAEPIQEARDKQIIQNSRLVADESQIANAALVAANNQLLDAMECEFTDPKLRITEADLPKELKVEDPQKGPNRQGLSEIMAELDFLFELPMDDIAIPARRVITLPGIDAIPEPKPAPTTDSEFHSVSSTSE